MGCIPCEMHAYEAAPCERYAYERYASGMVHRRCTPIECPPIEDIYLGNAINESTQIVFTIWESQMASLIVYEIYGNFDFREWFCGFVILRFSILALSDTVLICRHNPCQDVFWSLSSLCTADCIHTSLVAFRLTDRATVVDLVLIS
jgi:hypothetical protein